MNQTTINYLRRQAANKREVAARHAVGTAYHTRATLDAEALEAKAARIEQRIRERRR